MYHIPIYLIDTICRTSICIVSAVHWPFSNIQPSDTIQFPVASALTTTHSYIVRPGHSQMITRPARPQNSTEELYYQISLNNSHRLEKPHIHKRTSVRIVYICLYEKNHRYRYHSHWSSLYGKHIYGARAPKMRSIKWIGPVKYDQL